MEIKRIILIRHGESTANKNRTLTGRSDPELTSQGKIQAKKASVFIKKRYSPIDVIYTSPLKRAYKTAEIISRKVKAPLKKNDLLLETNFGCWEGCVKDTLKSEPEWEKYLGDPFHFHFPGGESPQDVKKRILAFKKSLLMDTDWRNIVVVSHYTPTVFFILSVFGNDNTSHARFRVDNASLTVIEKTQDFEYIGMLNFTP